MVPSRRAVDDGKPSTALHECRQRRHLTSPCWQRCRHCCSWRRRQCWWRCHRRSRRRRCCSCRRRRSPLLTQQHLQNKKLRSRPTMTSPWLAWMAVVVANWWNHTSKSSWHWCESWWVLCFFNLLLSSNFTSLVDFPESGSSRSCITHYLWGNSHKNGYLSLLLGAKPPQLVTMIGMKLKS